MTYLPGDLNVIGSRHFYGFRLFLFRNGDISQFGEVRVGIHEPRRLSGFQESDLVDFSQHGVVLEIET